MNKIYRSHIGEFCLLGYNAGSSIYYTPHARFLLALFLDVEYGGDRFLGNVG
jgi:hypothetical protein